jgi:hypothetical protein
MICRAVADDRTGVPRELALFADGQARRSDREVVMSDAEAY